MAVLTFLIFLSASPPEILRGTILDPTGAAVAAARVEVSALGFSRSVSTNDSGVFAIEDVPAGAYSLQVMAHGFKVYSASVEIPSEPLTVVLDLAPRSEDLIVTTTQFETPLSMLGVSASVIDRDQMTQQQGAPVYQLLRDVPGLAVANTSRRGGTTSLYTRGGGTDANLVLVDGVQVNDPGGNFNFAHLMS